MKKIMDANTALVSKGRSCKECVYEFQTRRARLIDVDVVVDDDGVVVDDDVTAVAGGVAVIVVVVAVVDDVRFVMVVL